jgi:hypothetical protein
MCEQCLAHAEVVMGQALPGFSLMQATRDGQEWQAGDYGLVESNDPTVTFTGPIVRDPTAGLSDDAINAFTPEQETAWEVFSASAQRLEDKLVLDACSGYRLVSACMAEGYRPDDDGSLGFWLMNQLATKLANQLP